MNSYTRKKPSNSVAKEESQHHAIFVKPPPLSWKNTGREKHRTIVSLRSMCYPYAQRPVYQNFPGSLSIIVGEKQNKQTKHGETYKKPCLTKIRYMLSKLDCLDIIYTIARDSRRITIREDGEISSTYVIEKTNSATFLGLGLSSDQCNVTTDFHFQHLSHGHRLQAQSETKYGHNIRMYAIYRNVKYPARTRKILQRKKMNKRFNFEFAIF